MYAYSKTVLFRADGKQCRCVIFRFQKHAKKWETHILIGHRWRVEGKQHGFERLQIASLGSRKAVAVFALHVVYILVMRISNFCIKSLWVASVGQFAIK